MAPKFNDWSRLLGSTVDVWKSGRVAVTGTVDAVMPDSSALWLAADGVRGRCLIHKDEGFEVRLSTSNDGP